MRWLRRHWRGALLGSAAAAVIAHWLLVWLFPAGRLDERRYLTLAFPEAFDFSDKGGTPRHYQAFTPDREGQPSLIGVVFRSTEVAPGVRGYAGPVPVLVGIDREGRIAGVKLLEHHETPSYVVGVESPDFLRQFVGKSVNEPLRLGEDIDGVTRATVTATAVADGVRKSARPVARSVLGLPITEEKETPSPIRWPPVVALGLLAAIALFSLLSKNQVARWVSLILGLVVLGFWQGTYLSTTTFVNILLWRWPSFREHFFWYALVVFGVVMAVAWRNVYCARMCPFGALQEILNRFATPRLQAPPDEERQARRLRYLFLWLVVLAVFLFGRTEAANYEPFSTAFDFKGGRLRWAFLGVTLVLAAMRHRFWCRYFCPTGVWMQLLGRMRSYNPFD
jgi:hypothetical protein